MMAVGNKDRFISQGIGYFFDDVPFGRFDIVIEWLFDDALQISVYPVLQVLVKTKYLTELSTTCLHEF